MRWKFVLKTFLPIRALIIYIYITPGLAAIHAGSTVAMVDRSDLGKLDESGLACHAIAVPTAEDFR